MNLSGKFRGKVVNNIDPLMQGRIIPSVPAVSELPLTWAMPCVPYAGKQVGFFAIPPVGANVWVEFEENDPSKPIWTGCFWAKGEVPAQPAVPTTKVLQTERMSLSMNDITQTMELAVKSPTGNYQIEMNPKGITLTCGTVSISISPQEIELKNVASAVSVSPESIGISNGPSSVEVAAQAVKTSNGGASVEVTPASIALANGGASVELSPVTVNVNKGALEVM